MSKDTKLSLASALVWTVAAVLAWVVLFTGRGTNLQTIISILFTVDAVVWWLRYSKKQQEEQNHE